MLLSSEMIELSLSDSCIASGTLENPPLKHKTIIKAKTRQYFVLCVLRVVAKGL